MSLQLVIAAGFDALLLASRLLQRARNAHPTAGLWEAADLQWWWRRPSPSDDVEKLFWLDNAGPVAGILLTSWGNSWQCDPILVHGSDGPEPEALWRQTLELGSAHAPEGFDVPVADDDEVFRDLALSSGLTAANRDYTAWIEDAERLPSERLPDVFQFTDRATNSGAPHPMISRSGPHVAQRLEECPLYDPSLDLAVLTRGGEVAGYSLYWFDPVTRVGLVEPVRVVDDFQRLGIATAMLHEGINRLIGRGARRIKVSYSSEAAGRLYGSVGFKQQSSTTWYQASGHG